MTGDVGMAAMQIGKGAVGVHQAGVAVQRRVAMPNVQAAQGVQSSRGARWNGQARHAAPISVGPGKKPRTPVIWIPRRRRREGRCDILRLALNCGADTGGCGFWRVAG